jgi:hypothetical protein
MSVFTHATAAVLSVALLLQTDAPVSGKTWIGHAAEIEAYIRTVAIVKVEGTSVGVTKPRKATLAPGGPVEFIAFKAIPNGTFDEGFRESYKAEIAAYELDKLIHLDMVPPTVEKTYEGKKGAAVMWITSAKSFSDKGFKDIPSAPAPYTEKFDYMVNEAYLFDGLIGDPDPNLGNWLIDPMWNVILIDHSRAMTNSLIFPVPLRYIPEQLWNRIKALTIESLTPALSPWLDKGDIKGIITRRDKIQKMVDDLVKKYGADSVFLKEPK